MKKTFIFGLVAVFVTSVVQTSHGNIEKEWMTFKKKYEKSYKDPKEEHSRKNIFLENELKINKHNERYKNGEVAYSMKMNQFGDLMLHEFREIMVGYKPSLVNKSTTNKHKIVKPKRSVTVQLPESIDWVSKGYVTPVKFQGNCVAGWAFSATGSVEGQQFARTSELIPLSEQNLIDCALGFSPAGCQNGGDVTRALKYIVDNGGIQDESSYKYKAKANRTCKYDSDFSAVQIDGFMSVAPGDENLAEAVALHGPVSVSISTTCTNFQFYGDGVFGDAKCPVEPDHNMLVVGYGVTNGDQRYWIVKNSWGSDWGKHGYMWMSRDSENTCGISDNPIYPIIS